MAPSKRAAGTQAQSAAKKPKMIEPMKKQCKLISDCISKSEDLPVNAKSLLCAMVKAAPVSADAFYNEHPGTAVFKSMFSSALETIEAAMVKEIAMAEERLAAADQERLGLAQLSEDAEKSLTEKKEAVVKAKSMLGESAAAMVEIKQALSNAQTAQQAADAAFTKQSEEQETLQGALSTIERLQTSTDQADAMKEASATMAVLRTLNLEESMLSAVPAALGKPCTERGEFESIVLKQLIDCLKLKLEGLEKAIDEAKPEREQKIATTNEKLEAVKVATEQHDASATALSAAQKDESEGVNKFRVSQLQVKDFIPVTEQRKAALQKLKDSLDTFKSGPLAAFTELSTPPPPPPAEDELPPAEVKPADAPAEATADQA